ncbi:hydantoinase/oxoprolinase family protein [Anaerotruncus rubiinfantis]|uniref:hydantoinase/oxoprolinase family protein n=1 Tax=Anaerotruncus rubiinfantis TaxID=1720200 RepID=UPI0011CC468D|nr:hydantoinase/oxoprolinase family protein [Anaerotruncus rubiinfantis]
MQKRPNHTPSYRLAADIGGTFTDIVLVDDTTGEFRSTKVLTTPHLLTEGIMRGFDSILDGDYSHVTNIVHGTTAGLNAVIEKTGARCALVTTKGFRDVYEIGRGNRPEMYNCRYKKPKPLVPRKDIFEIGERIKADGTVLSPASEPELAQLAQKIRAGGYESVAICLLNSYVNPENERITADYLKAQLDPEVVVITSYETAPECREYERTSTTVLNAYIAPKTRNHLLALSAELHKRNFTGHLHIMQSSGGIMKAEVATTRAIQTLMSGPVGGAIGASAYNRKNFIGIDMGGTSFDVSMVVDGKIETTVESTVEGFPLLTPTVNISSIGAGGGSIAWNEAGGMRIGPRSAGARPGPACYGQGGTEPTITDANLALGRMDPENFLSGRMTLDIAAAEKALSDYGAQYGLDQYTAAEGICTIANHMMADAIREITVRRGIDPRDFTLLSFGGAGPMHACLIAEELDIGEVIVPLVPGAFSAWGMLQADVRHDSVRTLMRDTRKLTQVQLEGFFVDLRGELGDLLRMEGIASGAARFERSFDMRYLGQEYTITVPVPDDGDFLGEAVEAFHAAHMRLYGHASVNEGVELVNVRLAAVVAAKKTPLPALPCDAHGAPPVLKTAKGVFGGREWNLDIYHRDGMRPGHRLCGPAVVVELTSTTVVPPDWTCEIDENQSLVLKKARA